MKRDEEDLVPTTVRLPESLVETLDEAVGRAPDWLTVSRADLVRYGWGQDLDEWDESVRELVPDEVLAKYRIKRQDERTQAEYYSVDKREGWRGRVKSRLNKRLAGEEPYHPDGVETLAEGYLEELEYLDAVVPQSSRTVEEDRAWLEQQLRDYRDAWAAKTTVPDPQPFDGLEDEIGVGRDLLQLRSSLDEVVLSIEERASAEAYDPDSIKRALAAEWGVSEEAIETLLGLMVPDDVDQRSALKGLEEGSLSDFVPDPAIEETRADEDALPEDAEVRMGGLDLNADHDLGDELVESVVDADLPTETEVDVDGDALAEELDLVKTDVVETDGGVDS
jgi:Arc/MetJ-type ribon-helix-helix transcriptional regulator